MLIFVCTFVCIDGGYVDADFAYPIKKIVTIPFIDNKHIILTDNDILGLKFGKKTIAMQKYFRSIQLATENFNTSQYGFKVLDFELEDFVQSSTNPLSGKPELYEMDDVDELTQKLSQIFWAKPKHYHLVEKTNTFERKIHDKYDEKKAENAQEIWELLSDDKSKTENDNIKTEQDKQKDNKKQSNIANVSLSRIDKDKEDKAKKQYDPNYPVIAGYDRLWYLQFLGDTNVMNLNIELTTTEEIVKIIEYHRIFINTTSFDRKFLAMSDQSGGLDHLYHNFDGPKNLKQLDWQFLTTTFAIDINSITSVSSIDVFRSAASLCIIKFYIVMLYCKSILNAEKYQTLNSLRQNLYTEVIMDLIAIYKDVVYLENQKHAFTRYYLRYYKLFAYVMQAIKWMLLCNVYYSTFLENPTFWDLLQLDFKEMPDGMQAEILKSIYDSSGDVMIQWLKNNDGLAILFDSDFKKLQQNWINNKYKIDINYKQLWCLPDEWKPYIADEADDLELETNDKITKVKGKGKGKGKEKGKGKGKGQRQNKKRQMNFARGKGLKLTEAPPAKKQKIMAAGKEDLKNKLKEHWNQTIEKNYDNWYDIWCQPNKLQENDNSNDNTMSYEVDFGQIFGTYTKEFVDEQYRIEKDIQNKNNTSTTKTNTQNIEKDTEQNKETGANKQI